MLSVLWTQDGASQRPSCARRSMPVLCRAGEGFFRQHYGVFRTGGPGIGEVQGGVFVHVVPVGLPSGEQALEMLAAPSQSPGRGRAVPTEAERAEGQPATWLPAGEKGEE